MRWTRAKKTSKHPKQNWRNEMPTRYKETFKGITFYHFVAASLLMIVVTIIGISWTNETNKAMLGWMVLLLVYTLLADFVKSLAHARAVTRLETRIQDLQEFVSDSFDLVSDANSRTLNNTFGADEKLDQIIAHFGITGNEDNDTSIDQTLAESMEVDNREVVDAEFFPESDIPFDGNGKYQGQVITGTAVDMPRPVDLSSLPTALSSDFPISDLDDKMLF